MEENIIKKNVCMYDCSAEMDTTLYTFYTLKKKFKKGTLRENGAKNTIKNQPCPPPCTCEQNAGEGILKHQVQKCWVVLMSLGNVAFRRGGPSTRTKARTLLLLWDNQVL